MVRIAAQLIVGAAALVAAVPATAAAPAQKPSAREKAFERSLDYHKGKLAVRDARISLPRGFRYLKKADAQRTLTELYGNPPHPEVLALILPPKSGVLDNRYFIVVTYEDEGHVSDEDATSIDYDDLLTSMQEDQKSVNEERAKSGYEPVYLLGWADRPHYDGATHKLYWSSDLVFGAERAHTLNYEVRTLGREGMLALNAVAGMRDIKVVRSGMQKVLAASRLVDGRRYEDFREGDRASKLTIAAVVGGGAYVAAKTGLIALVIAKLKFVVIGIVALSAAVFRRLARR